jgi:hypothetical protein
MEEKQPTPEQHATHAHYAHAHPAPAKESNAMVRAIKWATVPMSAVVAYLFAKPEIHDFAYDRLKKYGYLNDIRDEFKPRLDAANRPLVERIHNGETINIAKEEEIRQLTKEYAEAIEKRMTKTGLGNTIQKWGYLHKSNKLKVITNAATTGGIALGVMLGIANSEEIYNAFKKKEAEQNGPTP